MRRSRWKWSSGSPACHGSGPARRSCWMQWGALGDRERAARAAGRHVEGGRQPGTQGVGAAGDGRVEELGHLLVLLLGQGEPGGGDPALHVPPREVGGTRVNPNPRMKRPWPREGPALWETLKVATFAIPQSHSVDCKAERVRPGRCGNDTPIVPSASWRRSKTVTRNGRRTSPRRRGTSRLTAGTSGVRCCASKTPVGISRLYLCAARRHTPEL